MTDLLIKFVEHSAENYANSHPLTSIDIMTKPVNAEYNCQNFPCRRNQRENVLFEVGHNVVNAYLTKYLQNTYSSQNQQGTRVVYQEFNRWNERLLDQSNKYAE